MPVLRQRDDDVDHGAPAAGAGIARGLQQRRVDLRQRVGDRADHQQREQMHVGDDDGEVGEQQEVERLRGDAAGPCSAWLKAPLRPRNGIQAMVRMMPEVKNGMAHSRNSTVRIGGAAHVEDQEIGDVEAEEQRDRPDDERRTSAS